MESRDQGADRRSVLPSFLVLSGLVIVFATWSTGSVYHADTFDPDHPAVGFLGLSGMSFWGVSNRTGSVIIFTLLGLGISVFVTGVVLLMKRRRKT